MRLDDFMSTCELRAIRFFSTVGHKLKDEALEAQASELANQLAEKSEDFSYHYDIALTAIKNVFQNPTRFTRLVKSQGDAKKEKQLLSFIEMVAD